MGYRFQDGKIYQRAFGGQSLDFGKGVDRLTVVHVVLTELVMLYCILSLARLCQHNTWFFVKYFALDLIMNSDSSCQGVFALNMENGTLHRFQAASTILATGALYLFRILICFEISNDIYIVDVSSSTILFSSLMHLSLRAMLGLTFLQPLLIHAQEMAMRWLHVLGSHSRIMTIGMKKLNYQQEIKEENINLQEFGALCFKRQIKQGRKEYKEKEIYLQESCFMLLRVTH